MLSEETGSDKVIEYLGAMKLFWGQIIMDYLELQQDSMLEYRLALDQRRNSHLVSNFGSQLKPDFSCEVGAGPSLREGVLALWGI